MTSVIVNGARTPMGRLLGALKARGQIALELADLSAAESRPS